MIFSLKEKYRKILVIGDAMLDTYSIGTVERISPEAPVPVLLKQKEKNVLGGAANVAANIKGAGCDTWLACVIGEDDIGDEIRRMLQQNEIHTDFVIGVTNRRTVRKSRFVTNDGQQLLRMDEETTDAISTEVADKLLGLLRNSLKTFDAIVLSDYLKGLLTEYFTKSIISLARDFLKPVLIDIKDTNIEKYRGAYLLKPNKFELKTITGLSVDTPDDLVNAGRYLKEKTECKYVLVTLGNEGMILIGDRVRKFPSIEMEVFDVSGAGDTALAYLAAGIVSGSGIDDSVSLANTAAGVQISKSGTSIVYLEEVERVLGNGQIQNFEKKSITCDMLPVLRKRMKGRKITFTNGCFDILHVGHIRYLQEASRLGDILVIGLNSDNSVHRLKGGIRPINNISDRIEMLSAYSFIDYIVVFDENTPIKLINALKPDYLVKGSDYKNIKNVAGWDFVISYGGKVKLIDYVKGKSTTDIINKANCEILE